MRRIAGEWWRKLGAQEWMEWEILAHI